MPVGSSDPIAHRDNYVRWATSTESQLEGILDRPDVERIFDNPRHRDICSMPVGSQTQMMISAEVRSKSKELIGLAEYLRDLQRRYQELPGLRAIVDTNVLLHHQRPDSVNWVEVLGEPASILLPLRVVEELDTKKYTGHPQLRQAARDLLIWLETLFIERSTLTAPLGDGNETRVHLLLTERPRYKPSDADEEILDACHEVQRFVGRATLVTGDTGMRLRARAEGLTVLRMPEKYRRLLPENSTPGPDTR